MLDKETLSKQKYIYCVYSGKDELVNVERFPVIYINKHYVYFKMPGDDALQLKAISSVKDSLDSLKDYEIDRLRFQSKYFWNVDENIPKTLNTIKEKYRNNLLKEKQDKAKRDLDQAKMYYEKALAEYQKYEE